MGSKALDATGLESPLHDRGSSLLCSMGIRLDRSSDLVVGSGRGPGVGRQVRSTLGDHARSTHDPRDPCSDVYRRRIDPRESLESAGAYPAGSRRVNARPGLPSAPDCRSTDPPDGPTPCYSAVRRRDFVGPRRSACPSGPAPTSCRQSRNLRQVADLAWFCRTLCRFLLLPVSFNPPSRRAER